ncbi:hypothetical protein ACFZCP_22325 [Streptomyces sp. NPDC007971]|uniref:hypothetical protein n=1 Tax=Streptomyces sp. NPDC007971 TaxID=3364799 RepID=UPI0036EF2E43
MIYLLGRLSRPEGAGFGLEFCGRPARRPSGDRLLDSKIKQLFEFCAWRQNGQINAARQAGGRGTAC